MVLLIEIDNIEGKVDLGKIINVSLVEDLWDLR